MFYFQCSTVNIQKYKGKYLLKKIPHASQGNFNIFTISNTQTHIQGECASCVTVRYVFFFFSHTSKPLRRINAFVIVLIVRAYGKPENQEVQCGTGTGTGNGQINECFN